MVAEPVPAGGIILVPVNPEDKIINQFKRFNPAGQQLWPMGSGVYRQISRTIKNKRTFNSCLSERVSYRRLDTSSCLNYTMMTEQYRTR